MTGHANHPDTHTHGLDPDCPRCRDHAVEPTGLDAANLNRIWRGELHTPADMTAYNVLYRAVVLTQRLSEALAWRDFTGDESITDHTPHPRPDQYEMFQFGGRA